MKKTAILISFILLVGTSMYPRVSQKRATLRALGSTSGSLIYISYIAIGTLADNYAKRAYSGAKVRRLIRSVIKPLAVTRKNLRLVISSGALGASDKKFVKKLITTLTYLRLEGINVNLYTSTKNKKYLRKFNRYRKLAWTNIKNLLNL